MELLSLITQTLKDLLTAVAAITATFVAIMGLNAWKRQLKGREEYDLARRYLRAIYKVRDSLRVVRNPFIPVEEMSRSLKEKGLDGNDYSDNQNTNRAVYDTRWSKVSEALSDLRVEQLEAEVLWGREAVEMCDYLDKCVANLMLKVRMFLQGDLNSAVDLTIYDTGEDNKFSKEIKEAVRITEDYLKPHLK